MRTMEVFRTRQILNQPDLAWQFDLERRAREAAERDRLEKLLAKIQQCDLPPSPLPRSQWFGMALACGLIGALAAMCIAMSFHLGR